MEKRWKYIKSPDTEKVKQLSESLNNIDLTLSRLLIQRGIDTYEKAHAFFRPTAEHFHDPFLLPDMSVAIARLEKAKSFNEKILVYGDYDVDGTTSVAIVYSFLKENGFSNIDFYIPDRYSEGYGISLKSIDYAEKKKISLVIALDCGIKAIEKIDYAKKKNIDFIICDHHIPGDKLPDAVAVIDAKRKDSKYPFDELSGCGVGFKLIQAFSIKNNLDKNCFLKYVDLVAISIASDIVPIVDENRVLCYLGLESINNNPSPAVEAILKTASITRLDTNKNEYVFSKKLNVNDLVFTIGPRINAAGRIKSGVDSVKLLISKTIDEAEKYAHRINTYNIERKDKDKNITSEAISIIDSDRHLQKAYTTVLFDKDWHKGVLGIVASRLIEHYYRPTIILTESNGFLTGSARSVKGFDIYNAIDSCSHLLEHFGGHAFAAGLSMKYENLDEFINLFEQIVIDTIDESSLTPEIEIDAELDLRQIDHKFYRLLNQFAPFGPQNMSPNFVSKKLKCADNIRTVGNNHSHLRLTVYQEDTRSEPFNAIAFNLGDLFDELRQGKEFDACYHIEVNEWNGEKHLQLNIKDIKIN